MHEDGLCSAAWLWERLPSVKAARKDELDATAERILISGSVVKNVNMMQLYLATESENVQGQRGGTHRGLDLRSGLFELWNTRAHPGELQKASQWEYIDRYSQLIIRTRETASSWALRKNSVVKKATVLQWTVRIASCDFKPGKKRWAGALLSEQCCHFVWKPSWKSHTNLN